MAGSTADPTAETDLPAAKAALNVSRATATRATATRATAAEAAVGTAVRGAAAMAAAASAAEAAAMAVAVAVVAATAGGAGSGGFGGRPGGGPRPYSPRQGDDGGMSLRLDPRRLGQLKQLAGEAGLRPGDLVRQWVEERLDAERGGAPSGTSGSLADVVAGLGARIAALEAAAGLAPADVAKTDPGAGTALETTDVGANDADGEEVGADEVGADDGEPAADAEPIDASPAEQPSDEQTTTEAARPRTPRARRVSATPSERVALHDEMIALLQERGPMTAGELAAAITERGRYAPPRSGKALDAAMVSQRVSNPTYRARFTRDGGRIGLAKVEGT